MTILPKFLRRKGKHSSASHKAEADSTDTAQVVNGNLTAHGNTTANGHPTINGDSNASVNGKGHADVPAGSTPPATEPISVTPALTPAVSIEPLDEAAKNSCPVAHTSHSHTAHPQVSAIKGLGESISKCPFAHGSVGVFPYPGYVHGKNPEICPEGCKPSLDVGRHETPKEKLVREALEYQDLFHKEMHTDAKVKADRVQEILDSIERTGTYAHTFNELQHGARVAWRNAPKCSNRKFWNTIQLLDKRHVTTAEGMRQSCLQMLEKAGNSGATELFITVFPPEHPLTKEGGARVWNNQLMRFAGYRQSDLSIVGDPAEVSYTEMLARKFGWKGPGTNFDILPLILQPSPTDKPECFTIPPQYIPEVRFMHPQYPWFASLGLKWYGIPCVSNMHLNLGGILYTGAPFTGWYADVELVRNLSDESRFDKLPLIAEKLGYNITENGNLWRDAALLVLNQAIVYSFQEASMGIVDHHTLMQQFWVWQAEEKASRGYVSVNWKWVIPPVAASTSKCYLGLNKTTEYTLQPAYVGGPGWKHFAREQFGPNFDRSDTPFYAAVLNPYVMRMLAKLKMRGAKPKPRMVVLFATVTGTAKNYAVQLTSLVKDAFHVQLLSVQNYEEAHMHSAELIILVTSTYGSGAPPAAASKFLTWLTLQGDDPKSKLRGKAFGVFGLGSSCYPRFCAAATLMNTLMLAAGGVSIAPVGKGDQLGGRDTAFRQWVGDAFRNVQDQFPATRTACEGALTRVKEVMGGDAGFTQRYGLVLVSGMKNLAGDTNYLKGPVVEVKDLVESNGGRATTLVRINIEDEPLAIYSPGDHIAIAPSNASLGTRLEEFANHLQVSLENVFDLEVTADEDDPSTEDPKKIFPLPNTFREIMTNYVALLDEVGFQALLPLSMFATDSEAEELKTLGASETLFQAWQAQVHLRWIDLFDQFPSLSKRLPVEVVLQIAPTIHARYYSIASSMLANPGEVHVVVGALSYKLPDGAVRYGQCSNYLTKHVKAGHVVRFKLAKVSAFKLPMDTTHPVIMVGAGTGLAPFRGFIQHRKKLMKYGELGPCVLVFGCRSKQDQICRDEIEAALAGGAISAVLLAYSREPGVQKLYVQQKLKASGAELSDILGTETSHVYICGDSQMSAEVSAAIASITGKEKLTAMVVEGRFHEDVFGLVSNTQEKIAAAKQLKPEQDTFMDLLRPTAEATITERVMKALDDGLKLNATDGAGNTLLHKAVERSDAALLEALLARPDAHLVINLLNQWHLTAAALAHTTGKPELEARLSALGGSIVSGMHVDFYPVHAAALRDDAGKVSELKASGAKLELADFLGATPMHLAALLGSESVLTLLICEGCNVNAVDRWGQTPLLCALTFGHNAAARALKAAGARVTASSNFDVTWPSMIAWSPTSAGGEEAASAKLDQAKIVKAQALWDFMEGAALAGDTRGLLIERGIIIFQNLFKLAPNLLDLFPFKDENGQPKQKDLEGHVLKVLTMIGQVVRALENLETLQPQVEALTISHAGYGVELIHYDILCSTFLVSFEALLGDKWSDEYRDVWISIFAYITTIARKAYE